MTRTNFWSRWLAAPSVTGPWAFFCGIAAVALPTLVRASLDDIVSGVAVTPYLPSVVLAAVFLGWKYAALVTLASATVADLLFVGTPYHFFEGPSDIFAVGALLTASAMVIGFVQASRSLIADQFVASHLDEVPQGIIFSLEGGQAWASWSGRGAYLPLGSQDEVAEMMEDFLAQLEFGQRLNRQAG